jgi:hypothetical protein
MDSDTKEKITFTKIVITKSCKIWLCHVFLNLLEN